MQKVIKDAIIDLNIEPSRLFLSCRSCHGLKPMIIVELGMSLLQWGWVFHCFRIFSFASVLFI